MLVVEVIPKRKLLLVSGRSHPELSQDIARHLGVELVGANLREFANGEIHCRYEGSLRGSDVSGFTAAFNPLDARLTALGV